MTGEESHEVQQSDESTRPQQSYIIPREALERIPVDEREEFSQKLVDFGIRIAQEEHYVGPLQPSREAERWDALVPGAAERNFNLYEKQQLKMMEAQDRIISLTEESARHEMAIDSQRHDDEVELTKMELKNTSDKVSRGQWFAFIAFIFVTVGGFYMVHWVTTL